MTAIDDEAQNLRFAVVLPETDELIGDVSMWSSPSDRLQAEIGYVFNMTLPVAILPPALADERFRQAHDRAARPPTAMQ